MRRHDYPSISSARAGAVYHSPSRPLFGVRAVSEPITPENQAIIERYQQALEDAVTVWLREGGSLYQHFRERIGDMV